MEKNFLLTAVFFLSVLVFLIDPVCAVTTVVEVGEGVNWEVSSLSAGDVTYPSVVYFTLRFRNRGTSDLNVSGNLSISKGGSTVYTNKVFEGNVSKQQTRDFTFSWTPTDTGDFLANVTINITNNELNLTNTTFNTTSFTVYSPPSEPPSSPGGHTSFPPIPSVLNISQTWEKISPDTSVTVRIESEMFAFTEIMIEVEKESQDVEVSVNRLLEKPGSVIKEPAGKVYQYIEIKHDNLEGRLRNVVIIFRVENEWLSDNNIDKSEISLNRYLPSDEWEVFPSTLINEDSNYAYYGVEVPGLSVFSITGREKFECIPKDMRCLGNELQVCLSTWTWETIETCEYGCSERRCAETTLCRPDEIRCLGNFLQRCSGDGSKWETFETCEYGCWDRECKGMVVSYVTQMAVFVLFAILITIVLIMVALVYMNLKMLMARKR
ncbi:MAG: PGF-pre-PGF domain-containing protein [Candidatus Aenigmarchaeota archaeon]|nr:PGF-pre-PGF domain-containing protein [Candidatus Aenigmarchaeota archaeon]NIP40398.1 PGF-pre-PGF domain-containing protein [Candidatus Aenigmarchaeota archaeon]NIQ18324.1 PGF-pre-PGF domain-containing protein [Candidatus Aenigmarchaeota archaeon]NIS73276.1 PGF-pre-PGF domain-containing protein [Candidatus Aenigmarchaeota archaeon]